MVMNAESYLAIQAAGDTGTVQYKVQNAVLGSMHIAAATLWSARE